MPEKALTEDQIYYREKRQEILEQKKLYRTTLKQEVIRRLGGRCKKCGVMDVQVLQVRGMKRGTSGYTAHYNVIMKLIELGTAHDLYVLCSNCVKLET